MPYLRRCRYLMANPTDNFFPGKLLLFGEHILLKGARAVAVPVPVYFGEWKTCDLHQPPAGWKALKQLIPQFDLALPLDFKALAKEVDEGLYFSSNIPEGYGAGSSGALCAGIYRRFGIPPLIQNLPELKTMLGQMESVFHGKSSGIDPLTSYINQALLISNQTEISIIPGKMPDDVTVFLVDTQQKRQTSPLVNWFLQQSASPEFSQQLNQYLYPAHEAMLNAWLSCSTAPFMSSLRAVSAWQLEHLQPMLPGSSLLIDWWREGIKEKHTILKICGAGGGGFLLGFTLQPEYVTTFARRHQLKIVFPFNPDFHA